MPHTAREERKKKKKREKKEKRGIERDTEMNNRFAKILQPDSGPEIYESPRE
jgi:hypothetical protein